MGDRSMKDELIPTSMTLQMQLGIWRVIQSQSAISISWVSFQWNVGTESWRTRWRIETRDWRNDTPTSIGSATCGVCNVIQSQSPSSRSLCNVIQSQSPISIFSVSFQRNVVKKNLENYIIEWDSRLKKLNSNCHRLYMHVFNSLQPLCHNGRMEEWNRKVELIPTAPL